MAGRALSSAIMLLSSAAIVLVGVWMAGVGTLLGMQVEAESLGAEYWSVTWVGIAVALFVALQIYARQWRARAFAVARVGVASLGGEESPWRVARAAFEASIAQDGDRRVRTSSAREFFGRSAKHAPEALRTPPFLAAGQGMLVSVGLLGTFFGLGMGLVDAVGKVMSDDPAVMQQGMGILLHGAQTAFSKSFTGVGLSVVWNLWWRHAELEVEHSLRRLADEVDAQLPYLAPELLLQRALMDIAKRQPDGTTFSAAALELRGGAEALSAISGKLDRSLDGFSAEAIGQHVAEAVKSVVDRQLEPVMSDIRTELRVLAELKRRTDTEVTDRLNQMVAELRNEVLLPIAARVTEVAEVVRGANAEMERTRSAVASSADATSRLTSEMRSFQLDTLEQLQEFSRDIRSIVSEFATHTKRDFELVGEKIREAVEASVSGLNEQRVAFEASAERAVAAFAGQAELLEAAGVQASGVIRQAGTTIGQSVVATTDHARTALGEVQLQFVGALSSQRASLSEVLSKLEAAYQQEVEVRKDMAARLDDVNGSVKRLQVELNLVKSSIDGQHGAVLEQVAQAVTKLAQAHGRFNAGTDALSKWTKEIADTQARFHREEDVHLAQVLEALSGVAGEIADAAALLRSKKSPAKQ